MCFIHTVSYRFSSRVFNKVLFPQLWRPNALMIISLLFSCLLFSCTSVLSFRKVYSLTNDDHSRSAFCSFVLHKHRPTYTHHFAHVNTEYLFPFSHIATGGHFGAEKECIMLPEGKMPPVHYNIHRCMTTHFVNSVACSPLSPNTNSF